MILSATPREYVMGPLEILVVAVVLAVLAFLVVKLALWIRGYARGG